MPQYLFTNLAPRAAVVVTDADDAEATTGYTDDDGTFSDELDAGQYIARTARNYTIGRVVPTDGDVWTYSEAAGGYIPLPPA